MGRKQGELPGLERKVVKEINTAAEAYVSARDKRMQLTEKESEAKQALLDVMKKHKTEIYRDDDVNPPLVITVLPGKDNVKVAEAVAYDADGYDSITRPKEKRGPDITA